MILRTFANITGANTTVLLDAKAGSSGNLYWFLLSSDGSAPATFVFQDTDGTPLSATHPIPANGVAGIGNYGGAKFQTAPGKGIQLVNSAGNMAITYGASYYPG